MPVATFVSSVPAATLVRWNPCAADMCRRELRAGEPVVAFLHSSAGDGLPLPPSTDPLGAALRNGWPIRDAKAVLETAGEPVSVSVSIEPLRSVAGHVIGTVTMCHATERPKGTDLTGAVNAGLQQAFDSRQQRERRLELALEVGTVGWWELNLETMVLTASAQAKANHGLSPDAELTVEHAIALIDTEYREAAFATVEHAILAGRPFELEVPYRWGDGTQHWMLIRGRVVDGTRLVGASIDVTEQRTMQHALHESEARFRALADNIAQLAWMADRRGRIFWYNRRWFEYTGATLEEVRGWGWRKLHHPDYVRAVVRKIARCFATGETWEDTFPLRGKDGTYRWFLSRAVPIRDEHGDITLWFGTNTDVTAQRRAEQALIESDRRKDDFLAMLGHELRNPLAPILTAAKILQQKQPADPTMQKASDTIVRQAMQMTKLVDDLLDISRIRTGKLRLEKRRVDVNTIVTLAVETCAPAIERRRHTVAISRPSSPVYLDVDAGRVVQAICNLVNNASKYMEEGGRIEITAREEHGSVAIQVRDEGVGIEPEMLRRIFDQFVQIGTSRHRADGGLGLGLSIVKAVVELHGGTVEARSAGIGHGSEFIMRLPTIGAPPS